VNQIIRIGMDTSKHIFQLHGVDAAEQPVLRKRLRRKQVLAFFAKLPPTVIGMEACGASHYWARESCAEPVIGPANGRTRWLGRDDGCKFTKP
jgi:hypothetical protein